MNSKDILFQIQLQVYELFKSQNLEFFDVVIEIDGKRLYANKLRLSAISTTFKSMLSDFTISKNDVIKIENFRFADFKRLLKFIYSGQFILTDKNVFAMFDIAEFYQINLLKEYCVEYLLKMEYNFENIFELFEFSNKYSSLNQMKKSVQSFIFKNFTNLIKCDEILKADKSFFKGIIELDFLKQEELFQAVYQWAEYQAAVKKDGKIITKNDAIKNEINSFSPYINFKKMDLQFIIMYVVRRGFLFSYDELSDILKYANLSTKVKITNSNGISLTGSLCCDYEIIEILESLQFRSSDFSCPFYTLWNTFGKIPSTSSPIKKKDGIKWYLAYFYDGIIGVKHRSAINERDYLLAEMSVENDDDFVFTQDCRIKIE